MRRVITSRIAAARAEPSGNSTASRITSPVGRVMMRTPTKPTITADQRRQPTYSPSVGVASMVMNNGPANVIAVISASGK